MKVNRSVPAATVIPVLIYQDVREAVTQYVMVRVPDARSHCERAQAHGAIILTQPADYMYGERQYGADDFAGHRWTFTETPADTDLQTWGGQYLNPD